MNFQMFKMVLEKAEEPEIKLPTFAGPQRKQGNSRKTSTPASLTTLVPLSVWITTNWKILKQMQRPYHFTCLLRNLIHAGFVQTEIHRKKPMYATILGVKP